MTIWYPRLESSDQPRYLALADAIAQAIADGQLTAGVRLPTHRDLADHLGVTVGTVTRAYQEAKRRGLVSGEVGRGTYVRAPQREPLVFVSSLRDPNIIDLSINRSVDLPVEQLRDGLQQLCAHPSLTDLMTYQPAEGMPHHREAGAAWIQRGGLAADPDQVTLTNGGQHALLVALMALTKPGDTLLTEQWAYPGVKVIAQQLHLNLQGVEMDEEGLLPEALAAACKTHKPRALVCTANIHNPTTAVLGVSRRAEVVEIALKHDLWLVEDDVYGFLLPERLPSLVEQAPDRTCYVTSLSKCLLPALRLGYLMAPPTLLETIQSAIRGTLWMVSPLMAELGTRWIQSGQADAIAQWQRQEATFRQQIAAQRLAGFAYQHHANGLHGWLTLPPPWRADDFAYHARLQSVLVTPASAFAVERRGATQAIRMCVTAPTHREQLEQGLAVIATLLAHPPQPYQETP